MSDEGSKGEAVAGGGGRWRAVAGGGGGGGGGRRARLHAVEVVLEGLVGLGAELRVVDRRDEEAPVDLLGGAGAVARERVLVSVRRGEEHLKGRR